MSSLEDIARGTGLDARTARRTIKRRAAARAAGADIADDFAPLLDELESIAGTLGSGPRATLAGRIATDLRDINARRERSNIEPDLEPMAPRKPKVASSSFRGKRMRAATPAKERRLRKGLMFVHAPDPKYLRKEASQGGASVGFVGAMARIMRVHQYGLTDHVTRKPGSPSVKYARRTVLGFTQVDRARIMARVVEAIGS